MVVLGLRCCTGFFLVLASPGYSLIAACKVLIVVASLVVEHRAGFSSGGHWAQ